MRGRGAPHSSYLAYGWSTFPTTPNGTRFLSTKWGWELRSSKNLYHLHSLAQITVKAGQHNMAGAGPALSSFLLVFFLTFSGLYNAIKLLGSSFSKCTHLSTHAGIHLHTQRQRRRKAATTTFICEARRHPQSSNTQQLPQVSDAQNNSMLGNKQGASGNGYNLTGIKTR